MKLSLPALVLVASKSAFAGYWRPSACTRWQIVLSEVLKPPFPPGIQAIDGDLYSNTAQTWSNIKTSGIKTICYFSAGSYEDWRPDVSEFNNSTDIGAPLQGWEGEWWLNTTSPNVRRIMAQRLDLAAQKGCDAVDPDNIDAFNNDGGGLGLTSDDAVDYVKFLATEAHNRNMSCGLKNGGDIVDRVLDMVDFQVNEQCEEFGECDAWRPFIMADKPVFGIEYTKTDDDVPDAETVDRICGNPTSQGFSTLIKHMNLKEWVITCNVTSPNSTIGNGTSTSPPTSSTAATYTGAAYRTTALSGLMLTTVAILALFSF